MLIQKIRLQRGWSQQQLADLSGLSVRTIQRLENGQPASTESLKSLAAVFDIAFTDLQPPKPAPPPKPEVAPATEPEPTMYAHPTPTTQASTAANPASPQTAPNPQHAEDLALKLAYKRMRRVRGFYIHALQFAIIMPLLFVINLWTRPNGPYWAFWPLLGWGLGLTIHGLRTFQGGWFGADWEKRQVEKYLGRDLG